ARMNDIEAAISENNFLTTRARVFDSLQELFFRYNTALRALLALQGKTQLRRADRSSAQFSYSNAGGKIRQSNGLRQRLARCKHRCHNRYHSVTGTRHIKDFPRTRRQVKLRLIGPQQSQTLF